MEITLEMVERLKEKADISYAQAKQALEYSGGNLLDALIYLEETGAIPREEGAYFSTKSESPSASSILPGELRIQEQAGREQTRKEKKAAKKAARPQKKSASLLVTLRRWLIDNELEIWHRDKPITALPVLILVLLVVFAPWFTLPVLILGLFLGVRYRFSGPDLERDDLNGMMGSVADTASDIGHRVMEEVRRDWHSDGHAGKRESEAEDGRQP